MQRLKSHEKVIIALAIFVISIVAFVTNHYYNFVINSATFHIDAIHLASHMGIGLLLIITHSIEWVSPRYYEKMYRLIHTFGNGIIGISMMVMLFESRHHHDAVALIQNHLTFFMCNIVITSLLITSQIFLVHIIEQDDHQCAMPCHTGARYHFVTDIGKNIIFLACVLFFPSTQRIDDIFFAISSVFILVTVLLLAKSIIFQPKY